MAKFNAGMGLVLGGKDFRLFKKFLSYAWRKDMYNIMDMATGRVAKKIQSDIRQRVLGKVYTRNKQSTIDDKGGNDIPLVDTGGLIREAIQSRRLKQMSWEVGVIGKKPSRTTGASAETYVRVIHDGATFAVNYYGRRVTIRIPPRPFLRDVFDDPKTRAMANAMWKDAMTKILTKHGKL